MRQAKQGLVNTGALQSLRAASFISSDTQENNPLSSVNAGTFPLVIQNLPQGEKKKTLWVMSLLYLYETRFL